MSPENKQLALAHIQNMKAAFQSIHLLLPSEMSFVGGTAFNLETQLRKLEAEINALGGETPKPKFEVEQKVLVAFYGIDMVRWDSARVIETKIMEMFGKPRNFYRVYWLPTHKESQEWFPETQLKSPDELQNGQ
jgi:hypothetical protein